MQKIFKSLQSLILPDYCVCCSNTDGLLCKKCYKLIQFNPCPYDNKLLVDDAIDQVIILAQYQPPISNLIKALKYQRIKAVSKVLAKLVFDHLILKQYDAICWAPASRKRVNERGYNQAELVARELGKKLGLAPKDLLIKNKETKKQAGSSYEQRINNLKNAFRINPRYRNYVINKKILIFDDVISTGSTVNECAQTLKKAGAIQTDALAIARS